MTTTPQLRSSLLTVLEGAEKQATQPNAHPVLANYAQGMVHGLRLALNLIDGATPGEAILAAALAAQIRKQENQT